MRTLLLLALAVTVILWIGGDVLAETPTPTTEAGKELNGPAQESGPEDDSFALATALCGLLAIMLVSPLRQ